MLISAAVTGTCECVSVLGPALGGGHGWLQGYYGLVADQFVAMNVVLADGTLRTIDADSDLWWAMKGAGQNFGIVTSLTSKIYEIEQYDWAIETLIFDGDNVEALYQAANEHFSNIPVNLINWSYWLNIPSADPDKVRTYQKKHFTLLPDPICTNSLANHLVLHHPRRDDSRQPGLHEAFP